MANAWDFSEDDEPFIEEENQPRKRGRPKGSTQKPFTQKIILEQFEDLYKNVEPMLSPEQKKYYKEAFRGNKEYDAYSEMVLFARLYGVYAIKQTAKGIASDDKPSKELAEVVNQFRQINLNIEDIQKRREALKDKVDESRDVFDPTRQSTVGLFENLHR